MDSQLKHRYDQLSETLTRLLEDAGNLPHDRFAQPLAPGKWSTAQTLWHVIRVIEKSLDYLDYKLSYTNQFRRAGFLTSVRSYMLSLSLRSKAKFKAPAATSDVPDHITLDALHIYAREQSERLKQRLESLPPALLHREVFKHPRAGRITIAHMLQFLQDHTLHHKRQTDAFLHKSHSIAEMS